MVRSYAKRGEASVAEGAICICQRHFKMLCEIEDAQAAPTRLQIGVAQQQCKPLYMRQCQKRQKWHLSS